MKLKIKSTRERLFASTMIVGSLGFVAAGQAFAQPVTTAPAASDAPVGTTPGARQGAVPDVQANGAITGTPGSPTSVQEVVVTGSRIPQPGLTSTSPLTVVNSQEIKLEGTTNVEDLLNNLPQAVAEQTSQVSNGSTGIATADLRGLGSQRTLVLIDGKRLMPGDPTQPSADLNNIPAQLVDRVEVTTGGASAIYGSDAVAGVVNFIMKRDFQGVRLDAQGGFFQTGNSGNNGIRTDIANFNATSANPIAVPGSVADGRKIDVTGIIGINAPDGRGNVTGYVEYRNLQPVNQSTRLGSACGLSTLPSGNTLSNGANIYDTRHCQGSSNSAYGHFKTASITTQAGALLANAAGSVTSAGVTTTNPTLTSVGVVGTTFSDSPNGAAAFVPYTGALSYNFAPLNYFQREDDRYTGGYFAHYAVSPMFDLYSDFMFNDDTTVAQIAPSGAFQGTGSNGTSTLSVNCNNPLLSASQQTNLCGTFAGTSDLANLTAGYRFAAGGPRQDNLRHTEYKIDIGSRGDLGQGWNYDAYLQYGTSIFSERYENDVSVSRLQNALLVNPLTGGCLGGQTGCVPANLFQYGQLSSAALAYTSVPGFEEGSTTEQVASASITGDLGQYGAKSPLATDGIGVAFGGEYRRENLVFNTDEEFSTGDLSGQGGAAVSNAGTFDVYELFGEVRVPLVQDKPFVKSFSFDGAYRFSDYSTAGITDTYEGELNYAVDRNFSLRGSYNRAVRAPNVNELFASQHVALFGAADPCAGANPSASLAACANSGVTAGQYGKINQCPASQCSQLVGGNANLAPEKADTFTAGAVFTPTWRYARGFTLTVDWFDIIVRNLSSAGFGGASVELGNCINSDIDCNLVHRDSTGAVFGNTGYVIATQVNTGFLRTEGVDAEANYRYRLSDTPYVNLPDLGTLTFNLVGTYTYESIEQPVSGGGTYNCAGLYGPVCSAATAPLPRYRQKTRLTWQPPAPFTVSLQWRLIDGMRFDADSSNPFLSEGVLDTADARIPTINYMDVSATYKIKDGLVARAGVNNVLDQNAPIVDSNVFPASGPPYGNGNTYPGLYDALGREFFFGITADF